MHQRCRNGSGRAERLADIPARWRPCQDALEAMILSWSESGRQTYTIEQQSYNVGNFGSRRAPICVELIDHKMKNVSAVRFAAIASSDQKFQPQLLALA